MSPDGESVYAASNEDDAVARFDRDTGTGALTPAGCIQDNDSGADTCADSADGLDGAASVAVSPDGKSLYVASFDDDAIVRFDRNITTGALTPAGCIQDNDSGADTCADSADGLDGALWVAVSPDGESVYAASSNDDAVTRFDRDTATGALTPAGLHPGQRQRRRHLRGLGRRPRRGGLGRGEPRRRVALRRLL